MQPSTGRRRETSEPSLSVALSFSLFLFLSFPLLLPSPPRNLLHWYPEWSETSQYGPICHLYIIRKTHRLPYCATRGSGKLLFLWDMIKEMLPYVQIFYCLRGNGEDWVFEIAVCLWACVCVCVCVCICAWRPVLLQLMDNPVVRYGLIKMPF